VFVNPTHGDERLREVLNATGAVAMTAVPLTAPDSLLGLLIVSVTDDPDRLQPSHDLLDRLSGVAAQATSPSRTAAWSTRSPIRPCTTS
jgi:hypothetical protein